MNKHLAIACAKTIETLYGGADLAPNVVARETDTQVLVEKMDSGHYAVIFPGTASLRDLQTDCLVRKTPWGAGSVHRGCAAAYASVRARIVGMLPPGARLVISGHSLGGALATLCAEDLSTLYWVADVITFGSMRVGNGAFARSYNAWLAERTVRLVNAGDPVPHLPWVCGTYRHVHTQHYLDDHGGLVVDAVIQTALAEAFTKINAVKNDLVTEFISVDAHHIRSYRRKLEALA